MNAQHKSAQKNGTEKVSVQLWVPPELREAYREVASRDERTVAGAIRHHMQQAVAEQEREAA